MEISPSPNPTKNVIMNRKEYWNILGNLKRQILKDMSPLFVFFALSCIFYLVDPEDLKWPVCVSAIGVLGFLGNIENSRRMKTRPYCSFTDDFIVLDYDRNFIPWSTVIHVIVENEKRRAKIWQSTSRNPVASRPLNFS